MNYREPKPGHKYKLYPPFYEHDTLSEWICVAPQSGFSSFHLFIPSCKIAKKIMKFRGGEGIMYFENILWRPKDVEDLGYSKKNHIAALNTLIRRKNSDKKSLLSDLGELEKEIAKIQKKVDDLSS